MRAKHSSNGNRLSLLLLQIVIIALCIGYMLFFFYSYILPDQQASSKFQHENCLIMSKRLNKSGQYFDTYRAEFLISYNVNNMQYSRWVGANGLDESSFFDRYGQETFLNDFVVGRTYPCYYNPNNPHMALIVLRHNWMSIYPIFLPGLIALITLYYLVLNLFILINRKHS